MINEVLRSGGIGVQSDHAVDVLTTLERWDGGRSDTAAAASWP
jgi:hypothetical protein